MSMGEVRSLGSAVAVLVIGAAACTVDRSRTDDDTAADGNALEGGTDDGAVEDTLGVSEQRLDEDGGEGHVPRPNESSGVAGFSSDGTTLIECPPGFVKQEHGPLRIPGSEADTNRAISGARGAGGTTIDAGDCVPVGNSDLAH